MRDIYQKKMDNNQDLMTMLSSMGVTMDHFDEETVKKLVRMSRQIDSPENMTPELADHILEVLGIVSKKRT